MTVRYGATEITVIIIIIKYDRFYIIYEVHRKKLKQTYKQGERIDDVTTVNHPNLPPAK